MKFEFTPISDEELNAPMYPAGVYEFKVLEANIGHSKSSGKPMITLLLQIEEEAKPKITVKDYLVQTSQWKLSTFCKSIGKEGLYKEGAIEESEIINLTGLAEFVYEKNEMNGREYLKVKRYLDLNDKKSNDDNFNENLPF